MNRTSSLIFLFILTLSISLQSRATIVQFQTVLGNFEVNLYDETTPQTVANFLAYVNSEAYQNSLIHRSVPGFVVQGGGFTYDEVDNTVVGIEANATVINEPVYSNVRGTIAMAKLGGNANSATNQWYFNLVDNSNGLDPQNGGFTVFGEVMLDGMDVVDSISQIERFNFGLGFFRGAFSDTPLRDYDPAINETVDDTNFVLITDIVVLDAAVDTASQLTPALNTLINEEPGNNGSSSGSGGGGSVTLPMLFTLLLFGLIGTTRRMLALKH